MGGGGGVWGWGGVFLVGVGGGWGGGLGFCGGGGGGGLGGVGWGCFCFGGGGGFWGLCVGLGCVVVFLRCWGVVLGRLGGGEMGGGVLVLVGWGVVLFFGLGSNSDALPGALSLCTPSAQPFRHTPARCPPQDPRGKPSSQQVKENSWGF